MYEIRIPDHVFEQASQAARAHHLSVEDFIVEAVQLHAMDDPEFFTKERIAEIREAAVEARTGNNISLDQLRAEMKEMRNGWQENRPA